MKRKSGFVLREIGGQHIAVAVGERARTFHGMITTTESGALLWDALSEEQTEESLTDRLLAVYDVTREEAAADVRAFVSRMREAGLLEGECPPADGAADKAIR
mgnify:FL=1